MDHQQAFLGDGFAGDLGVLRRFALFHFLAMAQRRCRIRRFAHCGSLAVRAGEAPDIRSS